jgi:hypothetical protein
MHLDSRFKALVGAAALAGLLTALAVGGPASASSGAGASAACTPSKAVEAIVDDSGSMSSSDPLNFRAKLMSAYLGVAGNQGKTLGAVKFSSDASPLIFPPQPINPGTIPTMENIFNTQLVDSGGTNYDAGFSLANNPVGGFPSATSRIFLSDGAPNPGNDNDLHKTPPVKTYVIGLGVGTSSNAVQQLTQIAADTGGPPPLFVEDAGQLQTAAGVITAGQNCKALITFTDFFNDPGDVFKHLFKAKGKAADLLTSWPALGDIIDVSVGGGGSKASIAKVRVKKKRGSTFVSVRIKGLKKGEKVKFKVRAKTLPVDTTATTQVIR